MGDQPRPDGLDLVERPSGAGGDLAHHRADAAELSAPVEQVGAGGEVPLVRQPVHLVAQVGGHPEHVVDDDHRRGDRVAVRLGHVRGQRAPWCIDADLGSGAGHALAQLGSRFSAKERGPSCASSLR